MCAIFAAHVFIHITNICSSLVLLLYIFIYNYIAYIKYVPLSHLRSKEGQFIYITYSTGSGMLTRLCTLCHQVTSFNEVYALVPVHISH